MLFRSFGRERFDLTEGSASFVFLGIGIVLVVVQGILFGRAIGTLGVQRLYPLALVLVVVGLGLVGAATTWSVLAPALVVLSLGQGVASPSLTELVHRAAPAARRGEAMGFQQSATAVARIVGPPLAGLLFDRLGEWSPMVAGAAITLVALVVLVSWRLHRTPSADMTPAAV